MKWVSAGLTFVNFATVCAVILGIVAGGLSESSALLSLTVGSTAAILAYLRTLDPKAAPDVLDSPQTETKFSKRAQRRLQREGALPSTPPVPNKYRDVWRWLLAACFAVFAFRSFCWLLYIEGDQLRIQSPNNLGDLALHITYIRNFANGVPLWPENPIYVFSNLRYPAGTDLFNALLCLRDFDLIRGLVWTGLLGSLATFYAFYRWGGAFGVAGFLFNGGIAGFQVFNSFKFLDYQGGSTIAWKSIPLAMFVTQRGLLYAIPAGLLLLWHWREKYFRSAEQVRQSDGLVPWPDRIAATGPLPFWIELSLYASMPLFHAHTFLALSGVLLFLFICGDAIMRRQTVVLVASTLVPATFFVWLVTDHFHAGSVVQWHPGWAQNDGDFAHPFLQSLNFGILSPIVHLWDFWFGNFGILIPTVLALLGVCGWRVYRSGTWWKFELFAAVALVPIALCAWRTWETGFKWNAGILFVAALSLFGLVSWRVSKAGFTWNKKLSEEIMFLSPAVAIFIAGFLFKFAPWGWDNLKVMIWSYFIVLPFMWTRLITLWSTPVRAAVCFALFASGFVCLIGGLAAGRPGFGFAERAELDGVGFAIRKLPVEARFAAYPTYNHPLLLQGRKLVLGYPGHLWTQGFDDYGQIYDRLGQLMQGADNWREIARDLRVRYIFWGREEIANYAGSKRPWEQTAPLVTSGNWGAIYDAEQPHQATTAH